MAITKASLRSGTRVQVKGRLYRGPGRVLGLRDGKVRVERLAGPKLGKVLLYNDRDLAAGKLSIIKGTTVIKGKLLSAYDKPKGLTAIQAKKAIARARRQTQQIITKAKRDLVRAVATIQKLRAKR